MNKELALIEIMGIYDTLIGTAFSVCKNKDDAEDIVSASLLYLCEKDTIKWDKIYNPKGYAQKCVYCRALNFMRDKKTRNKYIIDADFDNIKIFAIKDVSFGLTIYKEREYNEY